MARAIVNIPPLTVSVIEPAHVKYQKHGLDKPLFAREVLERASEYLTARLLGRAVKRDLMFQIRQTLREIFLQQACDRNLNPHGLAELIDKIKVEINTDRAGSIVLHVTEDLMDEIDRYLYNRKCYVCGMKIPGGNSHPQEECDGHLVEDVMDA